MDRVPSLCSSSPPAARETFLLEIFSLMALAISIILRNKHTKQGRVSSVRCSRKLGRQEREHICAPCLKDRIPEVDTEAKLPAEADKIAESHQTPVSTCSG